MSVSIIGGDCYGCPSNASILHSETLTGFSIQVSNSTSECKDKLSRLMETYLLFLGCTLMCNPALSVHIFLLPLLPEGCSKARRTRILTSFLRVDFTLIQTGPKAVHWWKFLGLVVFATQNGSYTASILIHTVRLLRLYGRSNSQRENGF